MKCKRIISVLMFSVIIFANSMGVYAEKSNVYEQIVEEYNAIYDVSLRFVEVSNNFDIDEYRKVIEELAKQERETLDFIQSRKNGQNTIFDENSYQSEPYEPLSVSETFEITETKAGMSASYYTGDQYHITCTYTDYGYRIGNPKNVSASIDNTILLYRAYDMFEWSYDIIDGGRTIAMTTEGELHSSYKVDGSTYFHISGVTAYTEFYK